MKVKLLPALIGIAMAAGMTAASADVTVFGHLDTAVSNIDNEVSGEDDTNFQCTTCSVGFKGSEDLGNGLKAIFKLDFQFDSINRNKGAITDRDQWLGLAGNFGKVRIGSISTHYKSHGAKLDPLYRTALQGREHGIQSNRFHSGAGEELQGRATNTLRYDSPNWNGLQGGFHYTLDSDDSTEDDNPFGIGASYTNGGIFVFGDWMTNDGSASNPAGDLDAWKVGGKYSLNNFAVMAQYESSEEDASGTEVDQWHVGGSYTMGNNMLYAAYAETETDTAAGAVDTDAWTIAGVHKMSKRTSVYLGYNSQDLDTAGDIDEFSLGMKHKF